MIWVKLDLRDGQWSMVKVDQRTYSAGEQRAMSITYVRDDVWEAWQAFVKQSVVWDELINLLSYKAAGEPPT